MGRLGHAVGIALLFLGALAVQSPVVVAQTPDAQRTAAARALFDEGLAFVQQHDWPQAVDRFRRVLTLRESAAVRLNLGLALVQTGKLVEASEMLRLAAQDHTAPEAVRHQATNASAQLDARIGRITVRVDAPQAGDDVSYDGTTMASATLGVAVPADPGTHTVALVRGGHTVATRSVVVPEGGPVEVTLAPTLAVAPADAAATTTPATTTTAAPEQPFYENQWFWIAVGGAVVLGVVIAIVAVVASAAPTPVGGNLMPGVLDVQVTP